MGMENHSDSKPNGEVVSQTPVTVQALQPMQREIDQKQNQKIDWALSVSIISAVVSLVGVYLTFRATEAANRQAAEAAVANKLTQAGMDRTSGKLRANFDHATDIAEFIKEVKPFMKKVKSEDGEIEVLRIDSIEELFQWGPHVVIKNTGDEIIDGVKLEVSCIFSKAYGKGVKQIYPSPVIFATTSVAESTTFGKLLPQKTMRVTFIPELLEQIRQADFGIYSDEDHEGLFAVRILCRIAGASNYDQRQPEGGVLLHIHWRPKGFKEEKKIGDLHKIKPHVILN